MPTKETTVDRDALANRHAYHPPSSDDIVRAHEAVRTNTHMLATWLNDLLPECDEKKHALDAMDLAMMHANSAIARTQQINPEAMST
jgi:hypothetical protein